MSSTALSSPYLNLKEQSLGHIQLPGPFLGPGRPVYQYTIAYNPLYRKFSMFEDGIRILIISLVRFSNSFLYLSNVAETATVNPFQ